MIPSPTDHIMENFEQFHPSERSAHERQHAARDAMRQAMQIRHYADADFAHRFGGAIEQVQLDDETSPMGRLLADLVAIIEEADAHIEAFWARRPRTESESVAQPRDRTMLSDQDAHTLQAFDMAMRIYHPEKSFLSGHFDSGSLAVVAMEHHDLITRFREILDAMDHAISYAPPSAQDPRATEDRYRWLPNRDTKKASDALEKPYDGAFQETHK